MSKNEKKAMRIQKSVRVALLRVAKLAASPDISAAQRHTLSLLRQELLRADLRCETLPAEFAQASSSPIILNFQK